MNVAVSYHVKEAVTGVSTNFVMDYPKVMFNQGKLKLPWSIELATLIVAEIDITWVNSGNDDLFKQGSDQLSVLVYNPITRHLEPKGEIFLHAEKISRRVASLEMTTTLIIQK